MYTTGEGLPACRRLLFPLLHAEKGRLRNAVANRVPASHVPILRATKEIGDVCTQEREGGQRIFRRDLEFFQREKRKIRMQ